MGKWLWRYSLCSRIVEAYLLGIEDHVRPNIGTTFVFVYFE